MTTAQKLNQFLESIRFRNPSLVLSVAPDGEWFAEVMADDNGGPAIGDHGTFWHCAERGANPGAAILALIQTWEGGNHGETCEGPRPELTD